MRVTPPHPVAVAPAVDRDVPPPRPPVTAMVDITVPVHNEQADLARSIRRLDRFLRDAFPFSCRITIADNASTDGTWPIARQLAAELPAVSAIQLRDKGRGRALRSAWSASDSPVLVYMDVDLSTDLAALLPLVAPLISGHSDLAIGSRLTRGARVRRGIKRELISRCYNLLLRATLTTGFSDAQCGFKAIRADAARALLPLIRDESWFFDTELLVLAERAGLRIHEVPVDWDDDPDSRVHVVSTAVDDVKGVGRLMRGLATGSIPLEHVRAAFGRAGATSHRGLLSQVARFAVVGVASTLAYLVLYVALRDAVGAQFANAIALLATAIGNTGANRRFTFGVRGSRGQARHQAQGLVVFALSLAVTSAALAMLGQLATQPGRAVELTILVAANLLATVLRFVLLRGWVFRATNTERAIAEGS